MYSDGEVVGSMINESRDHSQMRRWCVVEEREPGRATKSDGWGAGWTAIANSHIEIKGKGAASPIGQYLSTWRHVHARLPLFQPSLGKVWTRMREYGSAFILSPHRHSLILLLAQVLYYTLPRLDTAVLGNRLSRQNASSHCPLSAFSTRDLLCTAQYKIWCESR